MTPTLDSADHGRRNVEETLRRIRRLWIRDDQKDALIDEFNRRRRTKSLEGFEEILDLPWGEFCVSNRGVETAKRLLSEKRSYVTEGTRIVIEHIAKNAILQQGRRATLRGFQLCKTDDFVHKKTLKIVETLLSRPVETISFDETTTREEIVGSAGSMGRVMEAVRRAKCSNPVIVVEDLRRKKESTKVEKMILHIMKHKRSRTFVDEFIGAPFDLSNVIFIYQKDLRDYVTEECTLSSLFGSWKCVMTIESKIAFVQAEVLPPILAEFGLEKKKFLFDEERLRFFFESYRFVNGLDGFAVFLKIVAAQLKEAPKVKNRSSFSKLCRKVLESCEIWEWDCRPLHFRTKYAVGGAPLIGVRFALGLGRFTFINSYFSEESRFIRESAEEREAAHIARSYCKANAEKYRIRPDMFEMEITVEFAKLSDGRSCGSGTFLSIFSLLTIRRVRSDSATSGKITLSGRILNIGGVHLKSYTAYKLGIRRMVLPKGNRRSVEREIRGKLKEEMTFVFVETLDDLIREMMLDP